MKMIDALYPEGIPAGVTCDAIAAYIDHSSNPDSLKQAVAKYPDAVHVKISVNCTVGAHVLDVEPGTGVTPAQSVTWVVNSRKAGIDPTVYCNQLDPDWGWPAVRAAFQRAGVPEPHYWVAKYDGDPTIPAGASAKQYTDLDANGRNTYDTSNTAPGWMEDDLTPQEVQAAVVAALKSPDGKAAIIDATKVFFVADDGHQYRAETLDKMALGGMLSGLAAQIAAKVPGLTVQQVQAALDAELAKITLKVGS